MARVSPSPLPRSPRRKLFAPALLALGLLLSLGAASCKDDAGPPLARLTEARRMAAELRVEFNVAADASNRAVMADTDETSIAAATEAVRAKEAVVRDAEALGPLLRGLDYADESRELADFEKRYAAYDAVDRDVLQLAVENTNLKAQAISFGPASAAADAFRDAVEATARAVPARKAAAAEAGALAARAVIALREIQVLDAPHIAESDDVAMTRLEARMAALESTARASLTALGAMTPAAGQPSLATATASLDRFFELHAQLLALSRRNTNVRSLSLAMGQKRTLGGACESTLGTLTASLSRRGLSATR